MSKQKERNERSFGATKEIVEESEAIVEEVITAAKRGREKAGLSGEQRFYLSIIRWSALVGMVLAFFLFRSCGGTIL